VLIEFFGNKSFRVSAVEGETRPVIRQHYLSDEDDRFLGALIQGERSKLIGGSK
jgi:hypothetical protein